LSARKASADLLQERALLCVNDVDRLIGTIRKIVALRRCIDPTDVEAAKSRARDRDGRKKANGRAIFALVIGTRRTSAERDSKQ